MSIHYTDEEKIKRLTAWHESEKVEIIEKNARTAALEAQNKKLVEALKWAWDNMKFTEYPAADDAEYEICTVCGHAEWKREKDCEGLKHDYAAHALLSEVTK